MIQYAFRKMLPALALACAITMAPSLGYSQGKGHGKAKGKQNLETKENHGRDAGGLPFGLGTYMEKKEGELPSGLQKKKEDDESLPHGLEEGGKPLESKGKGKKSPQS